MSKKDLTPQQKWDKKHPDIIKKSKAEYERKNPKVQIRPDEELREWLHESRIIKAKNKLETMAAVTVRKLTELMRLEKDEELKEWLEGAREENESFISVVLRKLKILMKLERENK